MLSTSNFQKDARELTPICICKLRSPEESQIASPCPDRLRVSKTKPRIKMIWLQRFIAVDGKVTTGIMRTMNPYLSLENKT